MSESSAEEVEPVAEETQEQDPKKVEVSVEALSKLRGDKRAAKQEAESAKQALENKKDAVFSAADLSAMIDDITQTAMQSVNERLTPIERERDQYKAQATLGMSPEQAEKVLETKAKHADLSLEQAAAVARADSPDLFAQSSPSMDPRIHGMGLPVGGNSQIRTSPPSDDFVSKMNDAAGKGDRAMAQRYAREELLQRARNLFLSTRR